MIHDGYCHRLSPPLSFAEKQAVNVGCLRYMMGKQDEITYIMSIKAEVTKRPEVLNTEMILRQESQKLKVTNGLLEKRVKAKTVALERSKEQLEKEILERVKTEEKLQKRIAFDHILTDISTQFINLSLDEIDEEIIKAISRVATFTQFDRGYIYLLEENGRSLKNTHQWCGADGKVTLDDFQTLPADLFQQWIPQLKKKKSIQLQNITNHPENGSSEEKLLILQDVCSALIIPLVYNKETIGFLGFDSYKPQLPWQEENIDPLKVVADIFVSAMIRKKTEAHLAEERSFAQQIMMTMGQGLMMIDVEGKVEYVNPACATLLGCQPEAVIGKTLLDLTDSKDHPMLIQAHMRHLQGSPSSYETQLIKIDGSSIYVLVSGVPHFDHQNKIIGSIITLADLTDRHRIETKVQTKAEEIKAIYEAAIQLFKPNNVQALAEQIVSTAVEELGFDTCGVLLLQEPIQPDQAQVNKNLTPDNQLTWFARFGRYCNDVLTSIPLGENGLIATAVRQGEIIYAPDVSLDHRYLPDNTYTQSELVVPLQTYNHIIGAIDLQSSRKDGFDERSQRIITIFAEHASLALETMRLYDQLRDHTAELQTQISKRQETEQALRNSEHRYKELVESATDMIFRMDANGRCTYVNPVAVHMLGYASEKELIGKHYVDFLHPEQKELLLTIYTDQFKQKIPNTYHEFQVLGKNDITIWVGQNVQLILENDEVIGFQAIARDISKQREAEEKLFKRSRELNQINAKLARALRTKDEFLANMSHELRTPLNAILGKTEILTDGIHGPITEKQAASLKVIGESGRHLLQLINDILDLAKIEAGKIQLDIQPIALDHLSERSLQFVRQMAHKKQVKLQSTIDPSLKSLPADERRLTQILINLLSNAVKFTPAGGKVGLNILQDVDNDTVQFQVWDTGIGIASDDMPRLFKPFAQLDSSLARLHEGTGLGLSLVYRLSEIHCGCVSLESQVGVGSCFTVTLPQHPCTNSDKRIAQAKIDRGKYEKYLTSSLKDISLEKPLILLVEDNETNIETVSEYLSVWGFRLATAHSGIEALRQVKDEKPDLILMDIQLPEMDGITAVRQLRQNDDYQKVPIIAMTALAMSGDKERCLAAGANEYLSKPIQLRQLVMMIDRLLAEVTSKVKETENV